MKKALSLLLIFASFSLTAQETARLTIKVAIDPSLSSTFKNEGRLMVFLNDKGAENPMSATWPNPLTMSSIFAKNLHHWDGKKAVFNENLPIQRSGTFNLSEVPHGDYTIQALWVQEKNESRIQVPGNFHSKGLKISLTDSDEVFLLLDQVFAKREVVEHPLVKTINLKSQVLSEWWGKDINVKATILLPSGYAANPNQKYPVRYNAAGYGGRYTRVNRLIKQESFRTWWESEEAPQVITVFLDGEAAFGDSYQMDSENNGPYGQNLVNEIIPYIESNYRTNGKRYTDGCSTGGWVSLALQIFHPDVFDACYSYSPDPVDFHDMQLFNIYDDKNAFYNKYGYETPSNRKANGEPVFSIKAEINSENLQGKNGTYTTSGQQWSGWNAVYSPKLASGIPAPLFDPISGDIDKSVAEHWKKYDLLHILSQNWETLGPKLSGKINVTMGDMDNYYLNNALRKMDAFLQSVEKPKFQGEITFKATEGHCNSYSHKEVLSIIGNVNK